MTVKRTRKGTTMYLTQEQIETLLKPINPSRVLSLSKGKGPALSYVAQHDVRAHLNRIFGFGRWTMDVKDTAFIFEEKNESGRWITGYRAVVRLTILAPDGTEIAHYEDAHASSNAPQPDRGEAHALALTIAVSTAMKRAAASLGDQFGLSLYNKGQTAPFVKGTLVRGADTVTTAEQADVDGVAVTSLGEDQPDEEALKVERADAPAQPVERAVEIDPEFLERLRAAAQIAEIADRLQLSIDLKKEADERGYSADMIVNAESGFTLGKVFDLIAKGQ